MKKTLTITAAGMALILSAASFADQSADQSADNSGDHTVRHHAPPTFDEVDADGDRMVTKDELHAYMEQRRAEHERKHREHAQRFNPFDRADVDQDGILNQEEFDGMMENMHHMRIKMREKRSAPTVE